MTPIRNIAFVGATGMLGKPVALAIRDAGIGVRAVVRDIARARTLLSGPIEYVAGDVTDTQSLARAFAGTDAVYVNLSTPPAERKKHFHPESDGVENVIDAARLPGVRRIYYLSSLMQRVDASGWWVLDIKRRAVRLIRESGLAYTLFYATNFAENLYHRNKQGSRVNLAGKFRHANYWIAGEDFARQVVASMRCDTGTSREYVIQGPEALTYEEAARVFVASYSKERLKVSRAPLAMLKAAGAFSRELRYVARILETVQNQPEVFEAERTWRELGKPTTTVAAYARAL